MHCHQVFVWIDIEKLDIENINCSVSLPWILKNVSNACLYVLKWKFCMCWACRVYNPYFHLCNGG